VRNGRTQHRNNERDANTEFDSSLFSQADVLFE
jgi:hypothetical protein